MNMRNKKTIMPKERAEIYRQDFQERHKKAFVEDIRSLSAAIETFHGGEITVWHCCTSHGGGYYTISNGEKKRFVRSAYELERVGGCWSLHVYERLYMGQVNLMRFLESVRDELDRRFSVEMPLKTLYIAYILTDLGEWEDRCKKDECYREEDKREFEIACAYQKAFTEKYADQIEMYNAVAENGDSFWNYYNGVDNYEYCCVSDILKNAVNEIYKNRERLESCELWGQAKKVIDMYWNQYE